MPKGYVPAAEEVKDKEHKAVGIYLSMYRCCDDTDAFDICLLVSRTECHERSRTRSVRPLVSISERVRVSSSVYDMHVSSSSVFQGQGA